MSIAAKIFQHIKSNIIGHRKGSVYLSWPSNPLPYSSPKLHQRLPQLPLRFPPVPDLIDDDHNNKPPLSLVESTYYLLAPKQRGEQQWKPWIAKVEELDSRTWRLLEPTGCFRDIVRAEPPMVGRFGDPSNYLIKELSKSYSLIDEHGPPNKVPDIVKVIPLMDPTLKLLALGWDGQLYFWKQGDKKWTNMYVDDDHYFFWDIGCHRGKLYALNCSSYGLYEIITRNNQIDNDCVSTIKINIPSSYGHLSIVEYNDQLCLLENGVRDDKAVFYAAHPKTENTYNWEVLRSLKNQVVFKISDASFTLPACLLDRKSDGDWICFGYKREDLTRLPIEFPSVCDGFADCPRYLFDFNKCKLELDQWDCNSTSIASLPDCYEEYVSIFYPPPPWLQYYSLDAERGFPAVHFPDIS